MATLERTHVFRGDVARVFGAIKSYDKYPKYIQGVTSVEVFPSNGVASTQRVRYELNLIKKFYYVLEMTEKDGKQISWNLVESNLMKENSGSWTFSQEGKNTRAEYQLEVKFKGLIPSKITDQVAKANLPAMFDGFQKMIDEG